MFCSDEAQDTHTEAAPRSPTHILKGGYYKFEDKDSAERKPATLEMEGVLYRLGAGSWVWVFRLFFCGWSLGRGLHWALCIRSVGASRLTLPRFGSFAQQQ